MPNSIDFYKGIFLYDIPVRIIVPCFKAKITRLMNCSQVRDLINTKLDLANQYSSGACGLIKLTKRKNFMYRRRLFVVVHLEKLSHLCESYFCFRLPSS